MLVITPNNTSTTPFGERESASDCIGCFARTQASLFAASEVVQLHDWAATKYWGERVFEVRDADGFRYDRLESELTPVEATHPDVLDFAAKLQGSLLNDVAHILADAAAL
jgi:hypothetical protein